MPLPVLPQHALTSDEDLLRLYQRTERLWAAHLGDAEQLDVGVAISNPDLPNVHDANRLLEAALPPGVSADEAYAEVERHFEARGVRCWNWQLASRERGRPRPPRPQAESSVSALSHAHEMPEIEAFLSSNGFVRTAEDVMALSSPSVDPSGRAGEDARAPGGDVMILPTRAAMRQARTLAEESDTADAEPTLADARMLHLDDPHCDSLLALRGGRAVGRVTVFAVGEIGRIDQVYVSSVARRQGIGRLLLSRAMEICARSLFKQVMLTVDPANAPAIRLYEQFGFRQIGELVNYRNINM